MAEGPDAAPPSVPNVGVETLAATPVVTPKPPPEPKAAPLEFPPKEKDVATLFSDLLSANSQQSTTFHWDYSGTTTTAVAGVGPRNNN